MSGAFSTTACDFSSGLSLESRPTFRSGKGWIQHWNVLTSRRCVMSSSVAYSCLLDVKCGEIVCVLYISRVTWHRHQTLHAYSDKNPSWKGTLVRLFYVSSDGWMWMQFFVVSVVEILMDGKHYIRRIDLKGVVVQWKGRHYRLDVGSNEYFLYYSGVVLRCARRMCATCARNNAECLSWLFLRSEDGAVRFLWMCPVVAWDAFRLFVRIPSELIQIISALYRYCHFYSPGVMCGVKFKILVLANNNFENSYIFANSWIFLVFFLMYSSSSYNGVTTKGGLNVGMRRWWSRVRTFPAVLRFRSSLQWIQTYEEQKGALCTGLEYLQCRIFAGGLWFGRYVYCTVLSDCP